MYSHSKKWVSDKQKARDKLKTANKTRNRMFPKSCAWTADYDLTAHHQEMAKLRRNRDHMQVMREARDRSERRMLSTDLPEPIVLATSVQCITAGSNFCTNHSAVLAQPTVFSNTYWKTNRPLAPWPCKEELFHEGDHRISNDKHLRRMLPAPRIETNETVAWSKRPYISPLPFDDFRINRNLAEQVAEIHEPEAVQILGSDLYELLNPINCL